MGFSRQEYWSGLPFPSPEDLPHPGIEPRSPALQADALPPEPPGKPMVDGEPLGNSGLPQAMMTGISPAGRKPEHMPNTQRDGGLLEGGAVQRCF